MKATLTPDRGDRPQFMTFCKQQLAQMNDGQTSNIIVDYKPFSNQFDLVKRFKTGVQQAKDLGIDNIIVVESDDKYPTDYFKNFDFDTYDIMGWGTTMYYNIRQRTYQTMYHEDTHSSLCCTAFKISALEGFVWPPDDNLWLDIALWKFAKHRELKWKLFDSPNPVIGIKHGVGRYGGKGHTLSLREKDLDLSYLKSRMSEESFQFYSNLQL